MRRLAVLELLLQRRLDLHALAQLDRELVDVDALEKFLDGFGAHHGLEAGGAVLLVELAEAVLVLDDFALLDGRVAGIDDDVALKVENAFEVAQRDVEQVADARRQALEEPDVRAGGRELDVAETLTANLGECDFDAALVADDAAVLHALVLAAEALPVGDGSKDAGAEKSVALRFEGTVVDGLGLGYFAVRPAADLFGRSEADPNCVEVRDRAGEFKWAGTVQDVPPWHLPPLWHIACGVWPLHPGMNVFRFLSFPGELLALVGQAPVLLNLGDRFMSGAATVRLRT